MIWALIVGLALLALVLVLFVFKAPRGTREAVAAALLLGIAGYVTQGSPALPGAPKAAGSDDKSEEGTLLVLARNKVTDSGIPPTDRWIITSDGFMRNGQTGDAAQMLRAAIAADPKNSQAWLAMANALLAHADGTLTPASIYAYRNAAKADPDAPGPPFFLGLAFAQSGRFAEAHALWSDLLGKADSDAPWRPLLAMELSRLETFVQARAAAASGENGQSAEGVSANDSE